MLFSVIPAKAGIQFFNEFKNAWTPVFTGVTIFYETINSDEWEYPVLGGGVFPF